MSATFIKGTVASPFIHEDKKFDEGVAFANYLFASQTTETPHVRSEKLFQVLESLVYCTYYREKIKFNEERDPNCRDSIMNRIRYLKHKGIFDIATFALKNDEEWTFFSRFRDLRNEIAHGSKIIIDGEKVHYFWDRITSYINWYVIRYGMHDWRKMLEENRQEYLAEYKSFSFAQLSKEVAKNVISIVKETVPSVAKRNNVLWLNQQYWNSLKINDENERIKAIARYYTHTDSTIITTAVAQESGVSGVIQPNEIFLVRDQDGYEEQKSIAQILDLAASQSFSLVKIFAEGGLGKSTFLFWISKKRCQEYIFLFLKRVNETVTSELLNVYKDYPNPHRLPIVLLIDNAAETETAKNIHSLLSDLRDAFSCSVVFIIAERESRYNTHFANEKLDKLFGGNVQTVFYTPANKDEIFENVYFHLTTRNPYLSESSLKENSRQLFLKSSVTSISEGIFLLLENLKLNYKIDYEFDWDDWHNFIKNTSSFSDLQGLFAVVACFFQFGVKLRVTFKSSFLRNADRLMIVDAITTFNSERNPIALDDDGEFLLLKHEYVASWFLKTTKGAIFAKTFVKTFINEINDVISAKLFRKIRKVMKLEEFKKSCWANELNPNTALEVVNRYLELPHISEEEKEKMLNEKGMIYLLMENEEEAKKIFELVVSTYAKNNHARDQLAKIYSKSPLTYQLAINKYQEILNNGEVYALSLLKSLVIKARSENVEVVYEEIPEIRLEVVHQEIREFLANKQYEEADKHLKKIVSPTFKTASLYREFAETLPFRNATIEQKEDLYQTAIELCEKLSKGNINHNYFIDYAVFLFRIRHFTKSSGILRECKRNATVEEKEIIESKFTLRIRALNKFFYKDIPENNLLELEKFLSAQKDDALKHTSSTQSTKEILMGALTLQSVIFHARQLPKLKRNAQKLLAYCYAKNADMNWNNLSPKENRIVAENMYGELIRNKMYLTPVDAKHLLDNLFAFKEEKKYAKIISISSQLLLDKRYKNYSLLYRFRGTARMLLGDLSKAMEDYFVALRVCTKANVLNKQHYFIEKKSVLYNIASLICLGFEKNMPIANMTIENAEECVAEIKRLPIDYDIDTLEQRIQNLRRPPSN